MYNVMRKSEVLAVAALDRVITYISAYIRLIIRDTKFFLNITSVSKWTRKTISQTVLSLFESCDYNEANKKEK